MINDLIYIIFELFINLDTLTDSVRNSVLIFIDLISIFIAFVFIYVLTMIPFKIFKRMNKTYKF